MLSSGTKTILVITNATMASVNSDDYTTRPINHARDVNANGQSRIQVGNNHTEVHNYYYYQQNSNRCLADLRLTDPRDDKTRIELTKGGLLEDSYKWILEHKGFRRWRDHEHSRLLWIKGDTGKGKKMLLCGVINEPLPPCAHLVSFFFCQGTDSKLNHANAAPRGLIYLLLLQQPPLFSYIQDRYDHAGRRVFEDTNPFYTLCWNRAKNRRRS